MIKLRPLVEPDIIELDKLWQQHWSDTSLPNRRNSIIDSIAVNSTGKIIGYGQLKLFAETMLFLDPTVDKREKVQAIKALMLEAFRGADRVSVEEVYAFIKDPDFALIIEKHFGFKRIVSPGELLLRKL